MACSACRKPGHDLRRCTSLRAAIFKIARVVTSLEGDNNFRRRQGQPVSDRDWRIEDLKQAAENVAAYVRAGVQ
jgi:hypothetical protein